MLGVGTGVAVDVVVGVVTRVAVGVCVVVAVAVSVGVVVTVAVTTSVGVGVVVTVVVGAAGVVSETLPQISSKVSKGGLALAGSLALVAPHTQPCTVPSVTFVVPAPALEYTHTPSSRTQKLQDFCSPDLQKQSSPAPGSQPSLLILQIAAPRPLISAAVTVNVELRSNWYPVISGSVKATHSFSKWPSPKRTTNAARFVV